jgi:DNA polymerase
MSDNCEIPKFNDLQNLKNFLSDSNNFEKFNFPKIAYQAKNLVFSKGNPLNEKRIIIVGEAPGAEEDLCGIPFCGRCGKLLERILKENNIDQDKDLYFLNAVFWRPEKLNTKTNRISNRPPNFEEISWCRKYVFEHIRLLKPKKIICLGAVAFSLIQNLNEKDKLKISSLVGKIFDYSQDNSMKVYPNFHPAFILRNEKNLYKKFSNDIKMIFED